MNWGAGILSLVVVWMLLQGSWDPWVAALGVALAACVLFFSKRLFGVDGVKQSRLIRVRPLGLLILTVVFFYELMVSSLQVVREAFRPKIRVQPAILRYPMEAKSDLQILTLASVISLTPGTLSLEVSPDRKILYIHVLSVDDDDGQSLVRSIHRRLERAVLRAIR
ncbi:MAG TPA: Na+/H+ antiporter subunit E [Myxococcales bacterium LLY-WYZ-16_1]|jgi:multicomponent Na+:H+ antiporter subunit E|nr:Na+/H+ antiporter subunit E [Myxococcales bacterium LLY-WYZ-16_1]